MSGTALIAILLQASSFDTAAHAFTGCLRAHVELGMRMRMEPSRFQTAFAGRCLDEEAAFRAAATKVAMENGRNEEQAQAEVATNIANGRRIFAADQASYVATGRVPR